MMALCISKLIYQGPGTELGYATQKGASEGGDKTLKRDRDGGMSLLCLVAQIGFVRVKAQNPHGKVYC
jgi:hypothetical protein